MLDGWMLDGCWMVGWLEKAELKPTQLSLAGAWLSLVKILVEKNWGKKNFAEKILVKKIFGDQNF